MSHIDKLRNLHPQPNEYQKRTRQVFTKVIDQWQSERTGETKEQVQQREQRVQRHREQLEQTHRTNKLTRIRQRF